MNNEVKICFVRHGETNENKARRVQGRKDFPLNETGIMQAHAVGNFLKQRGDEFDLIFSSPLSRAYDTACIIKNIIGFKKDIIKNQDFIERDFGVCEGMNVSYETFIKVLDDSYEGLEKSYDLQNRVYNGLIKIINEYKPKSILVVAHSHTIKGLLTKLDNSISFYSPMCNCAVNDFIYKDNEVNIVNININPLKNN